MFTTHAFAIPAKPGGVKVTQPDGRVVTLFLHGDEFRSFTTTSDGYTVVETASGWQYALKKDGVLVPSGMTAHDATARTAEEKEFVWTLEKMAVSDMTPAMESERRRSRSLWKAAPGGKSSLSGKRYDYKNFRGLVILVEWNDLSFTRSDANAFFSSMINDEGYGGYYTQGTTPQWVSCTGSVRDYFNDNSMGLFQPTFDVVGPVRIDRSHTYPQKTLNGAQCAYEALLAANSKVNFADYDGDGDGIVDMFYVIYAGYGSNVSGNSEAYIWPYASSMSYFDITLDGVGMGRYACSTEICASEIYGQKTLDGIGTICHEFSHVLGLPDLYDTDYEKNGQSNDPGVWSVMAGGGYLDNSRTPAGYGAYERYAVGFMQPETISEKGGTYTLEAINTSNKAYRINSSVDNEYFLLENRQRDRWDAALPGDGMLIFRVDSTNASIWERNQVNCYPSHNYYELLRAAPLSYNGTVADTGYDPFPGLGDVKEINNESTPSLLSWTGEPTPLSLHSISSTDGIISFSVGGTEIDKDVENFEQMELTTGDATGVTGAFCRWDMVKARVVATADGFGNGEKALGMQNGGYVTSSAISKAVSKLEFDFWNTTNTSAIISTGYSTDGGKSWTLLAVPSGQTQVSVSSNTKSHISYNVRMPANSMIRILEYKGSASSMCYIDDIKVIYVAGQSSGIMPFPADGKPEEIVSETFYDLSGRRVSANAKGLVIVKTRTADGKTVTRKVIK